jgi:serine/threonine protein kinase
MAPECTLCHKFLLSIKSDVYSYGVLVLEIITGHKIYTFEGQNSESLVEYVSSAGQKSEGLVEY